MANAQQLREDGVIFYIPAIDVNQPEGFRGVIDRGYSRFALRLGLGPNRNRIVVWGPSHGRTNQTNYRKGNPNWNNIANRPLFLEYGRPQPGSEHSQRNPSRFYCVTNGSLDVII